MDYTQYEQPAEEEEEEEVEIEEEGEIFDGDRSIHQGQTEQVQLNKSQFNKNQLNKWISEQIFDWSNTHWTNASEQNYWNNWTNVELNKLSQQGYPEAPPGGMRSGAQRHEARGVWGACPPFYMK